MADSQGSTARRAVAWLVYLSALAFLSPFWVIYVVASAGLLTDRPEMPSLGYVVASLALLLAVTGVVTIVVMRLVPRQR